MKPLNTVVSRHHLVPLSPSIPELYIYFSLLRDSKDHVQNPVYPGTPLALKVWPLP